MSLKILGPDSTVGKESAYNAGDPAAVGLIPESRRFLGGGHSNTLQLSCLGNPMDKRSLVGYSPKDHKELDMPEQLA